MIYSLPTWAGIFIFFFIVGLLIKESLKGMGSIGMSSARESDKHIRLELDMLKEIDKKVMFAVVIQNERTKNMCAATKNVKTGETRTKVSRNLHTLEKFIKDEYVKALNQR